MREILQQALDVIKDATQQIEAEWIHDYEAGREAIAKLEAELAKPEQEPVAWLHPDKKVDVVVPTSLAWFDKPILNKNIDVYKDSLSMSTILSRTYNNTIDEVYLRPIKNIYNNPTIKAKMRLPESVFQSFDFTSFIYLKTENLEGYFMVESIVNYQDSISETEVNLYMI